MAKTAKDAKPDFSAQYFFYIYFFVASHPPTRSNSKYAVSIAKHAGMPGHGRSWLCFTRCPHIVSTESRQQIFGSAKQNVK